MKFQIINSSEILSGTEKQMNLEISNSPFSLSASFNLVHHADDQIGLVNELYL